MASSVALRSVVAQLATSMAVIAASVTRDAKRVNAGTFIILVFEFMVEVGWIYEMEREENDTPCVISPIGPGWIVCFYPVAP